MKQVLDIIKTLLPNDYQKLSNINTDNKQLIEQHKSRIIQKIEEYGKYDDLNINDDKEAEMREHILKKYLWVFILSQLYMFNIWSSRILQDKIWQHLWHSIYANDSRNIWK